MPTPQQAQAELRRRAAQAELDRRAQPTFKGGQGGEFRGHGASGSFAPETLGEKIKGVGLLDVLAHLPFSPLHDYEKKGAESAKSKLRKGTGYGPSRVRTMGGVGFPSYQAPRGPQTVASLSKIVETQEEKEILIFVSQMKME